MVAGSTLRTIHGWQVFLKDKFQIGDRCRTKQKPLTDQIFDLTPQYSNNFICMWFFTYFVFPLYLSLQVKSAEYEGRSFLNNVTFPFPLFFAAYLYGVLAKLYNFTHFTFPEIFHMPICKKKREPQHWKCQPPSLFPLFQTVKGAIFNQAAILNEYLPALFLW